MYNSQELANAIKSFAKTKKISVGTMLKDCELSVNTLSSMKSGGYYPRLEAICKIADYLDCSVDYLLGRTDVPKLRTEIPNLTLQENRIIEDLRKLNHEGADAAAAMVSGLTTQPIYKKTPNAADMQRKA